MVTLVPYHNHMGQKDQDEYYAEKCHLFSMLEPKYINLKTGPKKSKKHLVHYFVYKSQYFQTNWAGYNRRPPRGAGGKWSKSVALLIRTLGYRPPRGPPSVPNPIFSTNNDAYWQDSALHILLLIWTVLKLVFSKLKKMGHLSAYPHPGPFDPYAEAKKACFSRPIIVLFCQV